MLEPRVMKNLEQIAKKHDIELDYYYYHNDLTDEYHVNVEYQTKIGMSNEESIFDEIRDMMIGYDWKVFNKSNYNDLHFISLLNKDKVKNFWDTRGVK